jgi:hypothetical protein
LVENEQRGGRSSSSMSSRGLDSGGEDFWRCIWKAPIPPKVKMFVWRLVHNSLALRPNLSKCGIDIDNIKCIFCDCDIEEGAHLLVNCEFVKLVWYGVQRDEVRIELSGSNSVRQALDIIWNQDLEKRV